MSYQRGASRNRWPLDARARVEWLEKEVARLRIIAREQEQRIHALTRAPEPHVAYRDTLTPEQRTTRPVLTRTTPRRYAPNDGRHSSRPPGPGARVHQ